MDANIKRLASVIHITEKLINYESRFYISPKVPPCGAGSGTGDGRGSGYGGGYAILSTRIGSSNRFYDVNDLYKKMLEIIIVD